MAFDFSGMSLADSTRVNEMRTAWDAYNGRFQQPLHNRPRRQSDAVILNRCSSIVDKGVAFLYGKGVQFLVPADANAQAALDGFWKANRKQATLQRLGINGGVTGHIFTKLLAAQPYPRLVALDSTAVSVEHAPDDIEQITAYCIHYSAPGEQGETVEYRQRIERVSADAWSITDQKRVGKTWQSSEPVPWPYPFSPIRQWQNLPNPNAFWGKPDLTPDLIQLNRDINFIASNINRIIKYHAHPKTWVRGLAGNKLPTSPDDTIILPEGAEMGSLEMHGDLSSSREYLHDLITAMDVIARTPALTLGDMQDIPRGTISGAAIELLFAPAVEKTESKRSLSGEGLEDVGRCVLALMGFDPTLDIVIIWPDMLPADRLAAASAAQTYLGLGISRESVYNTIGFSYKDEQTRLLAEARDAAVLAAARALPAPDQPGQPEQLALPISPDDGEQDDIAFDTAVTAA